MKIQLSYQYWYVCVCVRARMGMHVCVIQSAHLQHWF